jgi:hypothetical protein
LQNQFDVQGFENLFEGVELDGFFSVLNVEDHGFANACDSGQGCLAQPAEVPVLSDHVFQIQLHFPFQRYFKSLSGKISHHRTVVSSLLP